MAFIVSIEWRVCDVGIRVVSVAVLLQVTQFHPKLAAITEGSPVEREAVAVRVQARSKFARISDASRRPYVIRRAAATLLRDDAVSVRPCSFHAIVKSL